MTPHVQVNLRGYLSNLNSLYSLKLQVSVSNADTPLLCITFHWALPGATPQDTPLVTTTTKAAAAKTLCPAARPLTGTCP